MAKHSAALAKNNPPCWPRHLQGEGRSARRRKCQWGGFWMLSPCPLFHFRALEACRSLPLATSWLWLWSEVVSEGSRRSLSLKAEVLRAAQRWSTRSLVPQTLCAEVGRVRGVGSCKRAEPRLVSFQPVLFGESRKSGFKGLCVGGCCQLRQLVVVMGEGSCGGAALEETL